MSDGRLRELERQWRAGGMVADEAAYLLERVRAGDLARNRLELAAYCGHPAGRAVGAQERPEPANLSDLVEGVGRSDKEPPVRAAIAALWLALPVWEIERPECPLLQDALELACSWVLSPSQALASRLLSASNTLSESLPGAQPQGEEAPTSGLQSGMELLTDELIEHLLGGTSAGGLADALSHLADGIYRPGLEYSLPLLVDAVYEAAMVTDSSSTERVIRAELIAWALGRGDPVWLRLPEGPTRALREDLSS